MRAAVSLSAWWKARVTCSKRLRSSSGTLLRLMLLAGGLIEEAGQVDHGVVINGDDHVRVADVMDPGNVLVADAFDAVSAIAVLQHSGALQGLAGADHTIGEDLLEAVAAGNGACRSGGEG